MFPSEVAILMAIEEAEELTTRQLTHVTDVTGVHLRYLCNSLVRRGYLEPANSRGYRVTFKGKEAIWGGPVRNETGAMDRIC
jgi:DNA-binding IclR family transcriptional regulator